ncbi:MAG: DegT/DnrJ/EryC1/StrS family aminotransferase [Bryobacteraceae bacterium]
MTPFLDLGLSTQELRPEIDQAVARVLDSGRYIGGAEVDEFEREFAVCCGARFAVGVGNGLDAITLLLRAIGVGEGDEVIVPSNTYIATWLAVTATGARPVPAEPDPLTYNLDPEQAERSITRRTKAILAVHLYGRKADVASLRAVAERHGIELVMDAAQAHGIACEGISSAFSFYPSKNLGALGDGGAVVTDDLVLAEKIRNLGNYGSSRKYFHDVRGVNSRLDPLQAAILRVKLRQLARWNGRRNEIAARYIRELNGIPGLVVPEATTSGERSGSPECVWHLFPVCHPDRDWLARELARAGVGTLIHYPVPPHLSGAYASAGFRRGEFPVAELIAAKELSLPLHPHMTEEQVEEVIGSVCMAACLPLGASA